MKQKSKTRHRPLHTFTKSLLKIHSPPPFLTQLLVYFQVDHSTTIRDEIEEKAIE